MSDYHCEMAWDHNPDEVCPVCKLQTDHYGNTEEDFLHCSFPNCGCDGAQHCMAPEGANYAARVLNILKPSLGI